MTSPNPVVPLFFGSPDKRLFGCYHEPRIGQRRRCAVAICQPMGHEYIYCHRALRQLAVRLCRVGFPVLRFDFYGCGDSAGDADEGSLAQWLQDASTAVTEIKNRTGAEQMCLMGIRLGAAVAFAAAAQRVDIDSVVLWDPVISGRAYLEELSRLQNEALQRRRKPSRNTSESVAEIVGFPLPNALRAELEQLSLVTIVPNPRTQVLHIQSNYSEDHACLKDHLASHGARFEYQQVQAPKIWQPTVDGNLLVPIQVLPSIVNWTSRGQA
jgi:uncharacterized protein